MPFFDRRWLFAWRFGVDRFEVDRLLGFFDHVEPLWRATSLRSY